jgi:hypothetical protein
MKKYTFLVKTPTAVLLQGTIKRFSTGDLVEVYGQTGLDIQAGHMAGSEHLVLVAVEGEDEHAKAEPSAHDASPNVPPVEPEPTPDPVEPATPVVVDQSSSEEEMKPLPPDVVEKLKSLPQVPLPDNAHWSTVKAFLLGMEAEGNINLKMVEAVGLKYASYKAVKAEADRILQEHGAAAEVV